jgi:hypothetical protein
MAGKDGIYDITIINTVEFESTYNEITADSAESEVDFDDDILLTIEIATIEIDDDLDIDDDIVDDIAKIIISDVTFAGVVALALESTRHIEHPLTISSDIATEFVLSVEDTITFSQLALSSEVVEDTITFEDDIAYSSTWRVNHELAIEDSIVYQGGVGDIINEFEFEQTVDIYTLTYTVSDELTFDLSIAYLHPFRSKSLEDVITFEDIVKYNPLQQYAITTFSFSQAVGVILQSFRDIEQTITFEDEFAQGETLEIEDELEFEDDIELSRGVITATLEFEQEITFELDTIIGHQVGFIDTTVRVQLLNFGISDTLTFALSQARTSGLYIEKTEAVGCHCPEGA